MTHSSAVRHEQLRCLVDEGRSDLRLNRKLSLWQGGHSLSLTKTEHESMLFHCLLWRFSLFSGSVLQFFYNFTYVSFTLARLLEFVSLIKLIFTFMAIERHPYPEQLVFYQWHRSGSLLVLGFKFTSLWAQVQCLNHWSTTTTMFFFFKIETYFLDSFTHFMIEIF